MKVEKYDYVTLTDGREAAIADVLADGKYIVDICKNQGSDSGEPLEWETIEIEENDILAKTGSAFDACDECTVHYSSVEEDETIE